MKKLIRGKYHYDWVLEKKDSSLRFSFKFPIVKLCPLFSDVLKGAI